MHDAVYEACLLKHQKVHRIKFLITTTRAIACLVDVLGKMKWFELAMIISYLKDDGQSDNIYYYF